VAGVRNPAQEPPDALQKDIEGICPEARCALFSVTLSRGRLLKTAEALGLTVPNTLSCERRRGDRMK
jgi:hypothetical protein